MARTLLLAFEFFPVIGGAGTNAANLALGLSRIGIEVDVLTFDFGKNLASHDSSYPFRVIRIKGSPPKRKYQWLTFSARLQLWLNRNGGTYDLVLLTDWISQVLFNIFWPLTRVPFACIILGSEIYAYRNSLALKLMTHKLYDRAWGLLSISKYTEQVLHNCFPRLNRDKMYLLQVPIVFPGLPELPSRRHEIRGRFRIPEDMFVLLQVSRVVDRKGHRFVLEALSRLSANLRKRVRYVVVGTGPLIEDVKRIAGDLGIEDTVLFAGFVPETDLAAFYDACDVFVMPSLEARNRVEGFGIVYLEAAMRGKASIGTRHGAVPEVVLDGKTGLLAYPEDAKDLCGKIREFLDQPELAQKLGLAAMERARYEFSSEHIAKRLLAIVRLHGPLSLGTFDKGTAYTIYRK